MAVPIFDVILFFLKLVFALTNSALRMLGKIVSIYLVIFAVLGVWLLLLTGWKFLPPDVTPSPNATQTTIASEISFWESQLKKQPTSRDILWNLSQLEFANKHPEQAQAYLDQARQLDPNFQFSTNQR